MDSNIPAELSTGRVFRVSPSAAKKIVSNSQPARRSQTPTAGKLRAEGAVRACQSQAALTRKIKAHTIAIAP
jgi:hypothetical protein